MEEKKHIEIRSEEVQDILSRPPHSLIRWGSSTIGIIFLVLFVGSFFFDYPDTIECKITITTSNPPVWVVAKATGKIKEIYKADKQMVKRKDVLAVIENPADTKEVIRLKNEIETVKVDGSLVQNVDMQSVNFGDIQSAYTVFAKTLDQYNNSIKFNLYEQKVKADKAQLSVYSDYLKAISRQQVITHKQFYTNISNTKMQIAQSRNDILGLKLQQRQEKKENETALRSALGELKNAIRIWEQNYVLVSPIVGVLSYSSVWKENQNVTEGDKIFSIISDTSGSIVGKIQIPVAGSGKIKQGQRVNIKLDGYPYLEYGFLTGWIESISSLTDNNLYTATVRMPQKLVTSYHKPVHLIGELTGNAEIVTDNRSVGARILSPFRYIFKRNFK